MSDEYLKDQVTQLRKDLEKANAEAAKYRHARKDTIGQLEAVRKQLAETQATHEKTLADLAKERDTATTERDQWKTKAELLPTEQAERLKTLEGEIRLRDHRDAFRSVLTAEKAAHKLHDKASLDEVWTKIGYTPGDKLPTADEIAGMVGKAQEAAPYLFQVPDQASGRGPHGQGNGVVPGSGGRGQADLGPSNQTIMAQLAASLKGQYQPK